MLDEWNDKKEMKVLRRYRFLLTFRIIRVALLLVILYVGYVFVSSIIYDNTTKGEKLNTYAQLYIDWTSPGLTSGFAAFSHSEITPYLTQTTTVEMNRQIGKEEVLVSTMDFRKPLLQNHIEKRVNDAHTLGDPSFTFYLPVHPETGREMGAAEDRGTWEILEMVHEGTVADLAFSTKNYYTPAEIMKLVEDYDVRVTWIPLYLGELDLFHEGSFGTPDSISVNPWGLAPGKNIDEDNYRILGGYIYLDKTGIKDNQDLMVTNMRSLYENDRKLAESMFQTAFFKERLEYLEDKGFQAYGAVVTGPTKELLKLRELEEIQGVQLGDIEYWNWID